MYLELAKYYGIDGKKRKRNARSEYQEEEDGENE